MDAAGRHPHFVSPVFWHSSLAEGLVTARESQRAVLVIVGRQACGGSRALVEKTIGKEEIHEYVDAHYVCVAGDADAPNLPSPRWWRAWRNTIARRCASTSPPTGR